MGLHVHIYRTTYDSPMLDNMDCTNHGISSHHLGYRSLCLVNVPGPFEPDDNHPAAMLVPHLPFGDAPGRRMAKIIPAKRTRQGTQWKGEEGWTMFGGNYAASSDSRFWDAVRAITGVEFCNGALPIHDRIE